GNTDAFDRALVELRKQAEMRPENEFFWLPSKALLINAGPGEVLDRLLKSEKAPLGFDILIAQLKLKEALEYADTAEGGDDVRAVLKLHKGRALALLGEKEKAREIFVDQGQVLQKTLDITWADDLIKNEYRAGFKDLALEHLTLLLGGPRGEGNVEPFL